MERVQGLIQKYAPASGLATSIATFNIVLAIVDGSYSASVLRIVSAIFCATTAGLVVYILLNHQSSLAKDRNNKSTSLALATSIVEYGKDLSSEKKHDALIDLRNRASRLLHLLGARQSRRELGDITLASAAANGNRLVQASILIDDLGWSVFEMDEGQLAADNISEAIEILTQNLRNNPNDIEALELRHKAYRHMCAIEVERRHFELAQDYLEKARADAELLPDQLRTIDIAQLDHTAAHLLLKQLDIELGPNGIAVHESEAAARLDQALDLVERSQQSFESQHDLERAAKAAKIRCRLLEHQGNTTRRREAQATLEDIQQKVSRNLQILKI